MLFRICRTSSTVCIRRKHFFHPPLSASENAFLRIASSNSAVMPERFCCAQNSFPPHHPTDIKHNYLPCVSFSHSVLRQSVKKRMCESLPLLWCVVHRKHLLVFLINPGLLFSPFQVIRKNRKKRKNAWQPQRSVCDISHPIRELNHVTVHFSVNEWYLHGWDNYSANIDYSIRKTAMLRKA